MKKYHLCDKHGTVLAVVTAESPEAALAKVNEGFQNQTFYIDEVHNAKN